MDDSVLEWAYIIAVEDEPKRTPECLQALQELAEERHSELLSVKVAMEKSNGTYDFFDDGVTKGLISTYRLLAYRQIHFKRFKASIRKIANF
jgi:hypothetical protein